MTENYGRRRQGLTLLCITEAELHHWAMWTGGVYLLLLTQLLENKAVIDLTEADYVGAQKVRHLQCRREPLFCSKDI